MSSHLPYDEGDLLSRLSNGDMQAFDELYWKYQKAIYQNVFKLLQDEDLSEDIVQEVFINLWEKRQLIDTSRSIGGWLFVSSYNRSINALKKKLRESLLYKNLQHSAAQIGEEPGLVEIQLDILGKAISELSPQKRKVFELCKLKGLSYEEAAQELGISKHTVKEYLSAAVIQIKEFARQHPASSLILIGLLYT